MSHKNTSLFYQLLSQIFIYALVAGIILGVMHIHKFTTPNEPKKHLNIILFDDLVDPSILDDFKSEYPNENITITLKETDSDNEVLSLITHDTNSQYDLVLATDYMVDILNKKNLLDTIDTTKLSNYKDIYQPLKHRSEHQKIGVPFLWRYFIIAYNKDYYKNALPKPTWAAIFNEPPFKNGNPDLGHAHKIGLMDDGIVLSIVAGIFKYKKGEGFNERELSGIADLLCNQKKWVEAYNDANLRTFLRHELCSMVMLSYGGFLHLTKEDGITPEKFDYVFPEEGTLCAIELLCIPKGARNRDGAHKLIDFLISRKTSLANFKVCPGLPANRTALEEIESSGIYRKPTIPSSKIFKKFAFYQNQTSPGVFHEILLRVKNH